MTGKLKGLLKRAVHRLYEPPVADMEKDFLAIWKRIRPYTMTSIERGYALFKAVEHIVRHRIPGDFVECGVWRGGSACIAALSLLHFGDDTRDLYLYDTFTGMVKPTERDVSVTNVPAQARWEAQQTDTHNKWCYADRADVEHNVRSTNYPGDKLHFVEGKVEETIPAVAPQQISLLRLDTDWYDSTYHELRELYPRLSPGGVLILDDYGAWKGAREATDQYIAENGLKVFLSRIDMTGRLAIKG